MKAKLNKIDYQFFLYDNEDNLIATTENSPYKRLSMKNCQAIERGYDLDELAQSWAERIYEEISDSANILDSEEIFIADTPAFKDGFQKALEILGDKKFTEQDVRKAINEARFCSVIGELSSVRFHYKEDKIIQSLQQNEWECIILLDEETNKPLLDANGCLILKRV